MCVVTRRLAANLLRLLCADDKAREMIQVFDGIPLMLRCAPFRTLLQPGPMGYSSTEV